MRRSMRLFLGMEQQLFLPIGIMVEDRRKAVFGDSKIAQPYSPFRTSANASGKETRPSFIDLTSEPWSTTPHSKVSSIV